MPDVGRPSLYREEYCEKVVELGRLGMSVVEMATEIGVSRNTLETNWTNDHPEFLEALTYARECSQAWWEGQGRVNLVMPQGAGTFQASVWSRSMAARFPHDWREKSEQTLKAEIDAKVEARAEIKHLSPDEAYKRMLDGQ